MEVLLSRPIHVRKILAHVLVQPNVVHRNSLSAAALEFLKAMPAVPIVSSPSTLRI